MGCSTAISSKAKVGQSGEVFPEFDEGGTETGHGGLEEPTRFASAAGLIQDDESVLGPAAQRT